MIKIKTAVEKMDKLKNDILNSDEYCEISDKMEELNEKLKKLAEPLSKQVELVRELERKALIECEEKGLDEYDGYKVKYVKKSEVKVRGLYEELKHDIDSFLELTSITQKSLKDYVKEDKEERKGLLSFIHEISKKPKNLIIE